MQVSTLAPLCFCPTTELVISVPPSECGHARRRPRAGPWPPRPRVGSMPCLGPLPLGGSLARGAIISIISIIMIISIIIITMIISIIIIIVILKLFWLEMATVG